MLKTEQYREDNGHWVVQPKERARSSRPLQEGDIGTEKEGVVIIPQKTIPRAEGLSQAVGPIGQRSPGPHLEPEFL